LATKSIPIPIIQTFDEVIKTHKLPTNDAEIPNYIIKGMEKCKDLAQKKQKKKPSQLGRANGDWFEYFIEKIFLTKMRPTEFYMPIRQKITFNQLQGFGKVNWIPKPDVIVKDLKNVKGLVSIKWSMRNDRMYESAYEAAAVKNWIAKNNLPNIKVFLLTNDDSKSRLKIMIRVPELDGVYHIQANNYSSVTSLKSITDLVTDLKKL